MKYRLQINGKFHEVDVPQDMPLLWVLRDLLAMTGTKFGCGIAQCGACTVHVGGRPVLSCLTLAATVRVPVTTVEGLSSGDELHPVQRAFLDRDALQCGFCTPGQVMSAVAAIEQGVEDVREFMSGNICRCSAYPNFVAAVEQAALEQAAAEQARRADATV